MYKRMISLVLGLVLLVVLLQGIQPVQAEATAEKLTISILGDSISTFLDYSNGAAANTTNSTITNGATYYPLGNVSAVENTWWYKAAKTLNAEILVNNSWSGSCLYQTRYGTVGAYIDRCVQLHDDTGDNAGQEPDIIAIYMGTNDFNTYPTTLGSYAEIDFASLISEADGTVTYAQPSNSVEAYAIMLDKIGRRYPNAEVYCFTLLPFPASKTQPTDFNADIKSLAEHFGAYVVDLCDCGFSSDSTVFDTLMLNNLHPNDAGMTLMANAFAKAVQENHDHTYQTSVTAPTCTEQGYTTYTCACGHSYVDDYVAATGHHYRGGSCTVCGDDTQFFEWSVENGVLTITGNGPITTYGYQKQPWYAYKDSITKAVIGEGITDTGAMVFCGLSNLKEAVLPEGLEVLGSYAFYGCTSLTTVNIPKGITEIQGYTFHNCNSLSEITIPDSVKTIGKYAFDLCGLKEVVIPDSVTSLGERCFYGCVYMTKVQLSANVTQIPSNCFYYCSSLTTINLHNNLTYLGTYAFRMCNSLTSVTVPDSVTEMEEGVFAQCKSLKKAVLPKNLTFLAASMFYKCSALTDVTMPEKLEIMNGYIFQGCTSLTSITLPQGLIRIGGSCFIDCTSLVNVSLPNSLTSIYDMAFYNCTSLVSITLPDSITSMGESVFYNCTSLKTVNIPKGISELKGGTFCYCNSLETITIPGNVKVLYNFAIGDCDNLREIIFCEGVTTLEACAIGSNKSLTSVVLPDSLSIIGQQAFQYCTKLTTISLPAGLSSIESSAFSNTALTDVYFRGSPEEWANVSVDSQGNTKLLNATMHYAVMTGTIGDDLQWELRDGTLTIIGSGSIPDYETGSAPWYSARADITKILLPKTITTIGNNAFEGCNAVTQIEYEGTKEDWAKIDKGSGNDILTSDIITYEKEILIDSGTLADGAIQWKLHATGVLTISGTGKIPDFESGTAPWYANRSRINTIVVESGITGIGAYNFAGLGAVSAVSLPDGLTQLGMRAFAECNSLTSITIPDSVMTLGTGAFYKCNGLTSIVIPEKITIIPDECFYECDVLTGITFEGDITEIGMNAFYFCTKLTNVHFPASLKVIKGGAFNFCYGLTSIDLPDGLESIGRAAFSQCTSLVHVVIPNSVKSIGDYAFSLCNSLLSIQLPNGLTEIPVGFAQQSGNLKTVMIPGSVTTIGRMAFYQTAVSTVIYCGTDEQWNAITMDEHNTLLTSATRTSHAYQTTVTPPTCTAQGYTTHTCTYCGHSYKNNYVEALDHDYGEWYETKAPTCTEKGEERRDCKNCDHFETQEVVANGHKYTSVVTNPTCTEKGYTTHSCHCGHSYVDSYVNAKATPRSSTRRLAQPAPEPV